jgi:hypothetical protein
MPHEELELKVKKLELEHQDLIEVRNAILFVEATIPFAILTIAISNGWIKDIWSFLVVAGFAYFMYRIFKEEQTIKDNLLEGIRNQIEDLIKNQSSETK